MSVRIVPAANASALDFKQGMASYQQEKFNSILLPDIRPQALERLRHKDVILK